AEALTASAGLDRWFGDAERSLAILPIAADELHILLGRLHMARRQSQRGDLPTAQTELRLILECLSGPA
ncbi:MAG TPA: hypothetical protein VIY86_10385, partial [Pirellulaceae bacterium]